MQNIPAYAQLLITVGAIVVGAAYNNGQMTACASGIDFRLSKVEEKQDSKLDKYMKIEGLLANQNVRVVILEKDSESHHYRLTKLEND